MDEKLSGQLRRLNLERSKSRKPMAAINSSQKSLPCVQESKLIRTRNQVLSFPLLSFFLFFFSFKRTLLAYSLSPSETYAHLLSSSFFCDIKPEECRNGGIYIYTKEEDLVFGKEEGYLTDEIQEGGGDCQEIGPF